MSTGKAKPGLVRKKNQPYPKAERLTRMHKEASSAQMRDVDTVENHEVRKNVGTPDQEGVKVYERKYTKEEELHFAMFQAGIDLEDYYVRQWKSMEGEVTAFQPMLRVLGGVRGKKAKMKGGGRKGPGRERTTRVPISRHIVSDKSVVDLVYEERGKLSGASSVAKRWRTNGPFDVDPVLGGSSINGFNTWSQFYSFNRVLSYHVTLTLANQEATPVHAYFVHMNTDPGTTPTTYPIWSTQAFGSAHTLCGSIGKFTYDKAHSIRQIVGDKMPITSERYVGSSAANPADLTFFGVQITEGNGFEMFSGVVYQMRLTLRVEFFDRKNFDDVTSLLMKGAAEEEKVENPPIRPKVVSIFDRPKIGREQT